MPKHRQVLPVKRDRILNFMTAEELLGGSPVCESAQLASPPPDLHLMTLSGNVTDVGVASGVVAHFLDKKIN